ncbi:Hypothetical predicted protein [Paramuricea clavata]|uniref:Uncharacterized protein n=1 Tax=Paramuricea clavata TaxID=317549 RepID=A0A6S7INP9_PARCT|nr:Hypothetical predicted protein [Paramuricea clavata]
MCQHNQILGRLRYGYVHKSRKSSDLQSSLDSVQSWAVENKMELNAKKTKDMWINFTEEPHPLPLHIGDAIIERVGNFKLLGTCFLKQLKWNKHVEETTRKAAKNFYCLRDELERVQRRSLRIIGLPHGYLPTLEEGRIEATSRELDTILGDPSHIFYQRTMEHNKHKYNLRRRDGIFKYALFSGTERHRNSFIP